ncbi:hypothetical protein [Roseomonas sp. USHLN139]|uniref:hypothetical protein n=1 Tax=Roseomonas sp. USHLN139 TaxID=3081298 RepID=UPI003B023C4D
MYNNQMPSQDDLPSSEQLRVSTFFAAGVAAILLVFVVLPADYGVDPTRVGRLLGLTEMGEIKTQLAEEAAADAAAPAPAPAGVSLAMIDQRLVAIEEQLVRLQPLVALATPPGRARPAPEANAAPAGQPAPSTAPAPQSSAQASASAAPATAPAAAAQQMPPGQRSDEVTITLRPNQGLEVKMQMKEGDQVNYAWRTEGGPVNFDTHGEPPNAVRGFYHGYKTGRGVNGDEGSLRAALDGSHGWFWRNRSGREVTVTLRTTGYYSSISRP